jgi:alkanesulfonate monooxygenase SsuD/methylene tetrahydromethanopterin reductase-like flavin-dependent oxidoreductase (luciferase family)
MENHGTNPKTRFRLLRERVMAMKALWSDEEEPGFNGAMVNFDPVWSFPKPAQPGGIPVVMGGDGATTFDRVIEFCEGWMPIARGHNATDLIAAKVPELRAKAQAAGRDPDSISLSLFGCPPTPDGINTIAKAGFDRAIFGLKTGPRDDVLKQLDELAKAMI